MSEPIDACFGAAVASRPSTALRLLLVLCVSALAGCGQKAASPPPAPGPVEVGIVTVVPGDLVLANELSGRTVAFRVAEVRPQAAGIIQRRLFVEGTQVKAGDPLYQIDPSSYQAALKRAEATLAQAEAGSNIARLKAERMAAMFGRKLVSRQDQDDAQATLKQASAAVAQARAERDIARIDLDHTLIRAPISGRIGRSLVTEGALAKAEQDEPLATIQQIDPLFVDISQTSVELIRLKRDLAEGRLSAVPGNTAALRLILEDGTRYAHPGTLAFSEARVDESTGNLILRGTVPNPDLLLLPGMYVRASLDQGVRHDAILVPQKGVTFDYTGRPLVMLVGEDNKVQRRTITLDRVIGDQWLVADGLAAGDRVILDGLQKIREGAQVTTVPAATPAAAGASAGAH